MIVRLNLFVANKAVDDGLCELLYEMVEETDHYKEPWRVGDMHISDLNLFKSPHPLIQKQYQELGKICSLLLKAPVRIYDSWYHISHSGSAFKRHAHRNKGAVIERTFSFAYYVRRGDDNGSGQLRMFNPDIVINPKDGLLVIFPGAYEHEVTEYVGKTDRIMIGGNMEQVVNRTKAPATSASQA